MKERSHTPVRIQLENEVQSIFNTTPDQLSDVGVIHISYDAKFRQEA